MSLLAHFTYLIAYTIITEYTLLMGRSVLRIVSETELRYLGERDLLIFIKLMNSILNIIYWYGDGCYNPRERSMRKVLMGRKVERDEGKDRGLPMTMASKARDGKVVCDLFSPSPSPLCALIFPMIEWWPSVLCNPFSP